MMPISTIRASGLAARQASHSAACCSTRTHRRQQWSAGPSVQLCLPITGLSFHGGLTSQALCAPAMPFAAQLRHVVVPAVAVAAQSSQESQVLSEEERTQQVLTQCTRRIKELGARGRMRDAIETLAGLSRVGVQPDTQAATALVKACCKDMEMAQSIFDELFTDFLQPDEVTFAVLLRGYGAKTPSDWVRMDTVLSNMRLKFNLVPTATSYNALLEVCCRTNDLERGEDVIDRMLKDGVEPDEFTEECVASRKTLRSYLKKNFKVLS